MTDPWLPLDVLRTRTTQKWRTHPSDVLPLFVAEMDTGLAAPVVRAVTDAVARGDSGYPIGTAYAEAFAGFAAKRWGWEPAVEHTLVVPDVMAGLAEVLRTATGPGDPIVVNDPVYPPFYELVRHLGRTVVEVPLTPTHRLDLDALATAFARHRGRAVHLLCNPQNPTGTVHTRDELAALARLAGEHGVRVIADEIHAPLVDGEFTPYLTVAGTATATALHSASKGWNLAGLKAALAVAGADVAAELAALPSMVPDGTSHVAVLAHAAAFADGGPWLDDLLSALAGNRALLSELVAQHLPGVAYRPAPATYLAWLDCRDARLDGDPAAVFLERARVALVSGPTFGTRGAGHARLNLATAPEILTEAVHRMAA
ncbi:MAG: aminotransferase class I/II-fold pyridoxal phosphate-dependent enzyme, partial [Pseudonocardia sp.]|nr:aminotransferase class I/II-fold pyridoxal phosphate-dependent enzyme [Pseudonocardia sp.]